MSLNSWRPLSARTGAAPEPADTLFEGVPRHFEGPVRNWLQEFVSDDMAGRIHLRLRVASLTSPQAWQSRYPDDHTGLFLIDAVDAALDMGVTDDWVQEEHALHALRNINVPSARSPELWGPGLRDPGSPVGTLTRLLDDAGSAYRVREDGRGLEFRVDPTVIEAAATARATAEADADTGSAAEHLAAAWSAAYGLRPDPTRAYSETIKAVEAAAHAVIQPNHAKATLGTMLGELKANKAKFAGAIPDGSNAATVDTAEAMMRTLWEGQTSRHGNRAVTTPETLEAARAGVHLAVALVQWFASQAIVRVP
ncbi:hypothetical protein [Streptodolium elevatio]